MVFPVSAALLDALVLSIVAKEDTYGYKITQEIRKAIEMSESTLYPVLRRLLKDECLESYDMEYMGRNRRYYRVSEKGRLQLKLYQEEWKLFKVRIDNVIYDEVNGDE
ncbi:MAG: PadR family transcriptional regulator [Ruminococcus sp.]|nr:PadR family transcriptional regulator [Oscillospiraceae bacterium]MCI7349915.1 PadR family transcriptional regulator [Ruminococcus sp.]